MKIWLDDQLDDPDVDPEIRHTPDGYVGAKNAEQFRAIVLDAHTRGESIEVIDFDNDLGEETEGHHLLQWLVENYPDYVVGDTEIRVHSANVVEKEKMLNKIRTWRENPEAVREMKNLPHPFGEIEPTDGRGSLR